MIRQATRYDIPRLLEIVEAYAYENPIRTLADKKNHNARHVELLLFEIISGRGFVLIDKNLRGAIVAVKQPNIWCPGVMELHELLWWVEPEYRNGLVGGRLWTAFNQKAEAMMQANQVQAVISSISATGPLIDYRKRGYVPVGASFVKE
jgi:N-acetylglutamate synthase-like GNAT family acetyltransferase